MNPLRRLVTEAHRRSLWQVLGIYLVGSWVGYQVILNLMQGFGLPDWVAPFSLVLFLIGLPIVIATAFVQEGLPEKRDFVRADPHEVIPGFSTAADELAAAPTVPEGDRDRLVIASRGVERHLTWPKAILGGIVAFLVLGFSTAGYMGLRTAGIGPMGTLLGRGELSERDAIVLAQFTSAGGDSVLAAAVTEAFRVDFEQSAIVRLVGSNQIVDVLRRMQRSPSEPMTESLAREIAEREGYKAVVSGEVNAVGGGYVLSARLLAADGRVLASARETAAGETQVLAAIDGLSAALRERIGESLRTIRANPPLEQVTTASMDALRLYTQSLRVRDQGDEFHAIELLEQAIAIDSGFAMAWRKIGAISVSPGMDPDLRVRAATRAYELRDRLTVEEQHLAAAAYHSWVRGDLDAAMREYRAVLELDPDNTVALNNLSVTLADRGEYEEAERLTARAVDVGGAAIFFQNHGVNLFRLGRADEARAAFARGRQLYPSNAILVLYAGVFESAEGDFAASDSILDAVRATTRDANVLTGLQWQRAANDAVRGRLQDALRGLSATERSAREFSRADALDAALARGFLYLFVAGDAARARREMDAALERHPLEQMAPLQRPYGALISLVMHLGDDARARELIAQRDAAIPEAQRGAKIGAFLRVELLRLVRAGELDRAEEVFREIVDEDQCDLCPIRPLADAHLAAGNQERALELYEDYLAERYFWRVGEADAISLAHVLVTAAGLYEQRGDPESAARLYARFVELWQDADPELQPRVRAARERLQAIVDRRG